MTFGLVVICDGRMKVMSRVMNLVVTHLKNMLRLSTFQFCIYKQCLHASLGEHCCTWDKRPKQLIIEVEQSENTSFTVPKRKVKLVLLIVATTFTWQPYMHSHAQILVRALSRN